jgi:NADH:ubiquinone oxidoreductase subunit 4 (subunit M)
VLLPLVALAILMGVMSPLFTRRIEPSADALVRQVRARTAAAPAVAAASPGVGLASPAPPAQVSR